MSRLTLNLNKDNVKDVIISFLGNICGPTVSGTCYRSDVVLAFSRRDVMVTYTIVVANSTAVSTGQAALSSQSGAAWTNAYNNKGGILSRVSGVNNEGPVTETDGGSSEGGGLTVIAVAVVVFLFCVMGIVYIFWDMSTDKTVMMDVEMTDLQSLHPQMGSFDDDECRDGIFTETQMVDAEIIFCRYDLVRVSLIP